MINITDPATTPTISIAKLHLESSASPKIVATINSSLDHPKHIQVVLESMYDSHKSELTINPGMTQFSIPVDLELGKNPFFVKLLSDKKIIDIKEIILTKQGSKVQQPFILTTGNIIFNQTTLAYKSSSAKAQDIVAYFVILVLIVLSLALVWKK